MVLDDLIESVRSSRDIYSCYGSVFLIWSSWLLMPRVAWCHNAVFRAKSCQGFYLLTQEDTVQEDHYTTHPGSAPQAGKQMTVGAEVFRLRIWRYLENFPSHKTASWGRGSARQRHKWVKHAALPNVWTKGFLSWLWTHYQNGCISQDVEITLLSIDVWRNWYRYIMNIT